MTLIPLPFPINGVVFAWAMTADGKNYEIPLFDIADALNNSDLSIFPSRRKVAIGSRILVWYKKITPKNTKYGLIYMGLGSPV